ncbi:MAG: YceI family protein [Acidobacteriota bacterium]
MKRFTFLAIVALLAFVGMSNSGTNAVGKTFEEQFIVDGKPGKMGDAGVYNFDKPHSFIGFKVRHLGLIEVPGFFRDFTGAVNFDPADVTKSTVEFTAKAASVDTGVAPRDKHLRTADFFDVEKYPDITFKSTKVEKKGKGWVITGDFTMRGVTKPISFPFQIAGWLPADERSGGKMGITAETTINRRDYGVNYGDNLPSGVAAVSDNVTITLQIEAGKSKAAASASAE